SVELAPNPAKDEVVITYTIKENTQATFVLYNSEGKELVTKQLTGKGMQTVSLNNCPSGTYYYKVYTNEKVIKTDKLVIIK
ncbi:MAG: T9SS type A sorting domain-containing protein, partial [Bacteroidales bacterium]|nr:T9SS type A sorting domain-containing protein [Bacteroidales bacterium]